MSAIESAATEALSLPKTQMFYMHSDGQQVLAVLERTERSTWALVEVHKRPPRFSAEWDDLQHALDSVWELIRQ